jgi:hypothetical protein
MMLALLDDIYYLSSQGLKFKVYIGTWVHKVRFAKIVKGTDESHKAHWTTHLIVEILGINVVGQIFQSTLPGLVGMRALEILIKPVIHFVVKTVGGF